MIVDFSIQYYAHACLCVYASLSKLGVCVCLYNSKILDKIAGNKVERLLSQNSFFF